MNTVSDTLLTTDEDTVRTAGQEQRTAPESQLVEIGKVSDTSGGWLGLKLDVGLGFVAY